MHCSEAWVQGCGDESIVIVVKCGGDSIYLAILAFCPPEWAVNRSTSELWQLKRLHSLLSLMRHCCLGKFISSCDLQGGQAWNRSTTGVSPSNSGEDFNIVLSIWTFYNSDPPPPSREKCVGVYIVAFCSRSKANTVWFGRHWNDRATLLNHFKGNVYHNLRKNNTLKF